MECMALLWHTIHQEQEKILKQKHAVVLFSFIVIFHKKIHFLLCLYYWDMAHHIIYYQYGKVVVNVTEEDSAVGICPKYQYSLILGHHALVNRIMKHGKCISTSTNRFLQILFFFEKDSFEAAILASHIRNFCICFLPFLLKCCLDGSDFGLPLLYSYHTISPVLLLQSQLFLCLCQVIVGLTFFFILHVFGLLKYLFCVKSICQQGFPIILV